MLTQADDIPGTVSGEDQLVDGARAAARALAGAARERDRTGRPDLEAFQSVRAAGVLRARIPREYGGPGTSFGTLCEAMMELATVDPAMTQVLQPHHSFVELIALVGTHPQKERFFRGVLAGELWANAVVERGVDSVLRWEATADTGGGEVVVNGTKYYCTGSSYSDVLTVIANDDRGRPVCVMVDTRGVSIDDDWDAFGQRATASGTVRFAAVEVDRESLVDLTFLVENRSYLGAAAQLMQCAIDAGIARGALADAVDYVRTAARAWVDSGVDRATDDPYVQERVGRMRAMVTVSDTMVRTAASTVDAAHDAQLVRRCRGAELEELLVRASADVAVAKVASTEASLRVSEMLFELGGAGATQRERAYDRHWRNARAHTTHDPVQYKFKHLGRLELTGTAPPVNWYI
ncbi:MAG: acyl-CoA dehydrogenase family protein [Pseudonocardia sp.]